jgi:hypothetical protein
MNSSRELYMDQLILFQLFGDDEFYAVLPPGLEDIALYARAAYAAAVDAAMHKSNCVGCLTLKSIISPVQNMLGISLSQIYEAKPEALEPLAQLIARRRGYRPNPIILRYLTVRGGMDRLVF